MSSANCFCLDESRIFPLNEFANNNYKFGVNGGKFSKGVEDTVEREEIARYKQISPIPTVFLKDLYCRHVKNKGLFGKGLTLHHKINGPEKEDF